MKVLVVNVGSSSIKLRLVERGVALESVDFETHGSLGSWDVVSEVLERWPGPDAVGHRIVHGGTSFGSPAVLDEDTVRRLEELVPLAPLHQRRGLDAVEQVRRLLPEVPHAACFDTAFFAGLPIAARTYAVPQEWRQQFGVIRFGFHGLSHSYVARTARSLVSPPPRRIVTCHLGSGASLSGIVEGQPVDTTMGFTPLEGIVMSTRSGTIDPGIILWLLTEAGLSASDVSNGLEHRSGLLGLAGTADMREVLRGARDGDEGAKLALDVYVHRLRGGIAAMTAAMDGLDALVFTGGVGENSAELRAMTCEGLTHLGIRVDDTANASGGLGEDMARHGSAARVLAITSREDLEIATQVEGLLGHG